MARRSGWWQNPHPIGVRWSFPRARKPMTAASAGAGAAAAAAAVAAMMREEEEETPYMSEDLHGEYEFKILRSNSAAFRKPEVLQQALEEESQAGWVLLEKLDNSRLRLKRKRVSDRGASLAAIDPYRSYYGLGNGAIAAIIIGVIVGALAVVGVIVAIVK